VISEGGFSIELRITAMNWAIIGSFSAVNSEMITECISSFKGFAAVRECTSVGPITRVNGKMSFHLRLEFESFLTVREETHVLLLSIDKNFLIAFARGAHLEGRSHESL